MKAFVPAIIFLFITTLTFAQVEDTTLYEAYDTTITYSNGEYQEYNSEYPSSTYTKNPRELKPTKKELDRNYNKKKFSKTEWKKIVGETNYTEEQLKEKKKTESYRAPSSAWNPAILKIIGYILILLLIGAVIYFLLKNAMLDNTLAKNSIQGDSFLYIHKNLDEITESDIDRLLREALERNDFRVAVRLYYIKLLKHLNSTGFIVWKKDKTNHEYAAELSRFAFTRDFRKLMTAYEIIWYGERTPSTEEFKTLQVSFNELHRQATRTE